MRTMVLAEGFVAIQAFVAVAAGVVDPRHAGAGAERPAAHALADRLDAADALMAHDEGRRRMRRNALATPDVHVGLADAAGLQSHEKPTGTGGEVRQTGDLERLTVPAQDRRPPPYWF